MPERRPRRAGSTPAWPRSRSSGFAAASGRLLAGAALLALACGRTTPTGALAELEDAPRTLAAPAPSDRGQRCADVGEARVCWLDDTESGVVSVPRAPLPRTAPPRGYRCWGAGSARTCRDRALGSGPFECQRERCVQRFVRLPDDGEWECADLEGVVICRGWSDAAGVLPGRADDGWVCGSRRGAPNERICVDFAPDRPGPEPWSCRFHYEPAQPARSCVRGQQQPLGRPCGTGCSPFGVCRDGHCLPRAPKPDCWTDRDCNQGARCDLGTCRRAAG